MQNILRKKYVITIIMTLFLLNNASTLGTIYHKDINTNHRGTTYYVGGSGSGNYSTIQSAINAATNGDTIYVYNGSYTENIIINKQLTVIGEYRTNTIIDGTQTTATITITHDHVHIEHFTIKNGTQGTKITTDYNTIKQCYFINNHNAIYAEYADENHFYQNHIIGNANDGIHFHINCDENHINHTYIGSNSRHGVHLQLSHFNEIHNLTIAENDDHGMNLLTSNYNVIYSNIIRDHDTNGIHLDGNPYHLADHNVITNNTIYVKCANGIYFTQAENNTLAYNTILAATNNGITVKNSMNNTLYQNHISSCANHGISITTTNKNRDSNNHIYHNKIKNNDINAYDTQSNYWDNGTTGNYWDDYNGYDHDGDGIGDIPYNISGGANQDHYPLMTPFGPPHASFTYIITDYTIDFNASHSYDYNGYIASYDWEFGDSTTGTGMLTSHTYSTNGRYTINLTVTDNQGETDTSSADILVNLPPNPPYNPVPLNGSIEINIDTNLSWECTDPESDPLTYDVYFEANDPTPDNLVSYNQTNTDYDPGTLMGHTIYYWQIIARDSYATETLGPIWNFITRNQPPEQPHNEQPVNNSDEVSIYTGLSWDCTDPDSDPVTFDVYFGTNTSPTLVAENISSTNYDPGTLDFSTTYYWQIIAKDSYGGTTNGPLWQFTTAPYYRKPDLDCVGSLSWTRIPAGSIQTGAFTIINIGEAQSQLSWKIDSTPNWGTWTFNPSNGTNLKPSDGPLVINVEVIAPDLPRSEFSGFIKVINNKNTSDYDLIPVSLSTPKPRFHSLFLNLIQKLVERFPMLTYILSIFSHIFNKT